MMVSADAFRSTSGAFYSCGNFYEASTVLPLITTNGINLITNGFYRAQDLNITSRNDFGSSPITGQLFRLPAYEGRDLQNGRQQLLNENANAAVIVVTSGNLAHSVARFDLDWTQARPVGAASFALVLGMLPNRARIINVVCKTTQGWSGLGLGNVRLSIGDGVDVANYVLAKDITIPRETGTLTTDLGPLLNASANLAYGHLTNSTSVVLGSTLLYAQITATSEDLSRLNGGHTEIHITFEVMPGAPVFLASDIPDCKLWLRADMGVTVNEPTGGVTEWDDMSGNSNKFIQGIATNQPNYIPNAYEGTDGIVRPALRGTSTALLTDGGFSLAPTSPVSLVYVLTRSSLPGVIYTSYDSTHTVLYGGSAGHDLAWLNGSDDYEIAPAGTLHEGPHMVIVTQTDGGKVSAYLDYNEAPVFSHISLSSITGPPRNLFAKADDGDILDIMVFSRVLSPNEIFGLLNYARTTWFIPIRQ
jgi:hypothetical protein